MLKRKKFAKYSLYSNRYKKCWRCNFHKILELECFELERLSSPTIFAYQSLRFGTLDRHNGQRRAIIKRNNFKWKLYTRKLVRLITNWSKHILCNKWPQSGMWHGILDVWISPKHTGQFDRDIFSTHWRKKKHFH